MQPSVHFPQMPSFPLDTCRHRNVFDTTARWDSQPCILLSFRCRTASCHKTTYCSNPYFRLDNYPFIASKLNISLVFNQVNLVQMNALQLWEISERMSGCFVRISAETFCVWSSEMVTQQRLGKKNQPTTEKSMRSYAHAHTWCKVCWLFQDTGRAKIRSSRARISWNKTQTQNTIFGETTEAQLPSTQCRNWTWHIHCHQLSL